MTKLRQASEVTDDLTDVVSAAIADPAFQPRDQHAGQVVSAALRTQETGVLDGLVKRLEAGLEIPFGLEDVLRSSAIEFDQGPIVEAVLDPATPRNVSRSCSAVIGPAAVSHLLDEYIAVCRRLQRGMQIDKQDVDRRTVLMGLVTSTRPSAFAAAVIVRGQLDDPFEIEVMADLFDRHGTDTRAPLPFNEQQRKAAIAIFEHSAESLLSVDPPLRAAYGELARAIGRLRAPALLPALEQMLDKDLAALREQQTRPGVRHLYTNQYSRALDEIGTPDVVPILTARLTEVDFGFAAALVLKNMADRANGRPDQSRSTARWPDFAAAAQRRLENVGVKAEIDAPPADAIFNAVAHLRREGATDREQQLALSLAKVGVMLPHADHREDVDALLQMPHRVERLGLLLALVSAGETVSANVVLAGIQAFFEAAKTATYMLQQNLFELEEWLALLPFSDRPDVVVETVAGLPDGIRRPGNLHRLLSALAYAPGAAHQTLLELAERDASFYDEYEWLEALKARRALAASKALLDLIGEGKITGRRGGVDTWSLSRDLAAQMETTGLRAILRHYAQEGVGPAKAVAMGALAEAPRADDLLLLVDLYVAEGKPFDERLAHVVHKLALSEQAHEDWRGAYELVPEQLNDLRKQLFAMTVPDSPAASVAEDCLNAIAMIRDEYGAPKDERRHPDIASDRPWPLPVGLEDAG